MNRFFGNLLGALVQIGISELQRKAQKQGKIILPNGATDEGYEIETAPEQEPIKSAGTLKKGE